MSCFIADFERTHNACFASTETCKKVPPLFVFALTMVFFPHYTALSLSLKLHANSDTVTPWTAYINPPYVTSHAPLLAKILPLSLNFSLLFFCGASFFSSAMAGLAALEVLTEKLYDFIQSMEDDVCFFCLLGTFLCVFDCHYVYQLCSLLAGNCGPSFQRLLQLEGGQWTLPVYWASSYLHIWFWNNLRGDDYRIVRLNLYAFQFI